MPHLGSQRGVAGQDAHVPALGHHQPHDHRLQRHSPLQVEVARATIAQGRVDAANRVVDLDDVADAHVLQHHVGGLAAVVDARLEILLALQQFHPRRHEPREDAAAAMHLDRMQRERLVARVERDLHVGSLLDPVAADRAHRVVDVGGDVVRLQPGLAVGQQVLDAAAGASRRGLHVHRHRDRIDPGRSRLEQELARPGRASGRHRQCQRRDRAPPTPCSDAVPDGAHHGVHPLPSLVWPWLLSWQPCRRQV